MTSAATVAVAPPPNTEPTGLPAVTGTPQVGETLTADTSAIDDADGLTNATFEYQWLHNQSVVDANTGTSYYINVEYRERRARPTNWPQPIRAGPSRSRSPSPTTAGTASP